MVFGFTILSFSRFVLGEVGDCGCFGRFVGGRNDIFHLFLNLLLISGLIFVKLKTNGGKKNEEVNFVGFVAFYIFISNCGIYNSYFF
jgi:hypothetical protein